MNSTKKKHERAIASFQQQCENALGRLIEKIEPDLRRACEKWGFDFYAGNGSWGLTFGGKHGRQRYRKVDGQYELMGDPRFLMDFLEPELADTLETQIERQPLGSLMTDIETDREDYEWVVVKVDRAYVDAPTESPEILSAIDALDPDYAYFGWIPRPIADAVVEEYRENWEDGSQLISSLPSFLEEDLLQCPQAA